MKNFKKSTWLVFSFFAYIQIALADSKLPSNSYSDDSISHIFCGAFAIPTIMLVLVLLIALITGFYFFASKRMAILTDRIFKLLPIRMIVADKRGRIYYFAQGSLSDFEFKYPLKNMSDFYNKPLADNVLENIREVISSGKSRLVHFEINSQKRSAHVIKFPFSFFHSEVAGWISQDTQSLQADVNKFKIESQKYSKILESIADGVIVLDNKGIVTLLNPVAETITGFSCSESIGKEISTIFKTVSDENGIQGSAKIAESIAKGDLSNNTGNIYLNRKDGSTIHISQSISPIIDKGIVGAVLVFRDISEEDRKNDTINDVNFILETFMANVPSYIVAKDVNNNLGYVACNKSFSNMVGVSSSEIIGHKDSDFFLDKEELELISKNDLESINQSKIINHIMSFTRADKKRCIGDFYWIPVKLSGNRHWVYMMIHDITELYDSKIKSENIAERLRMTLNAIGDGVIVTDTFGNIEMVNPVAQYMMGCTQDEAFGHPHTDFFNIVNSVDNWKTPSPLTRSLRTGEIVELANHTDLISVDGKRYNISDSSAPIRDVSGKIIGGILVFRDVSEEYAQRRKLMNLTILLTSITDNLPAELFLKDADTLKYKMVNPSIERLMGASKENVIGKTDFDLLPKEIAQKVTEADIESLKHDSLYETTLVHRIPDGEMHYSRFLRKRIETSDGKMQILGIVVDMTHQEMQRLELERQKQISDSANKTLKEYVLQNDLQKKCITSMLSANDFTDSFDKIAEMIGNYMHSSCVAIQKFVEWPSPHLQAVKIWKRKGGNSNFNLTRIFTYEFPATIEHLKNGGIVRLRTCEHNNSEGLSGWKLEIYNYLKAENISEIICIPVMRNNRFWGYLGSEINDEKFIFGDVGERMLVTTANLLEILIAREEMRKIQVHSDEEKFMILDVLPLPVVLLDSNYRVLHANKASEIILKKSLSEILGHTCYDLLCGRLNLDKTCPIMQTLDTSKPQTYEKVFEGRTYMVNTMPIVHDGKIEKIIKVYVDLTEINRNKKLLQDALAKSEDAAKAKSQFLATMSHEIRTPLNAVVGFSELLQNSNIVDSERSDYLYSINLAGKSLLNLINDILDLSKMEASKIEIDSEPMLMDNLIEEMTSIFKHRFEEKNLKMNVNIQTPPLPVLLIDIRKLRQVLLNLIGNAVKFTNSGHVDINISYIEDSVEEKIGTLEICVIDTGIGITPKTCKNIFEPFVQDNNPLQNNTPSGTGLGLPIAKRIVEGMGGELILESEVGKGSSFRLIIHNVRSMKHNTIDVQNKKFPLKRNESARVLIVDDVPMNLKVLGAMLKTCGYYYKACSSGKEVLEILKSENFTHILTDLWMPEMDGTDLAEKIRALPNCAETKIIVITADVMNRNHEKIKKFDAVLSKPISIEGLDNILK